MSAPPQELPPPEAPAEEIRETAEAILARPEFGRDESLYDRLVGWLTDRLNDVLAALTGSGRGALIAWAILLAAIAAVGFLAWRVVRHGGAGARGRPASGAAISVDDPRRPSSHWHAEADAHASAGRWRDALRCRWRALVAELAERGRLEEEQGMTAGDYRRAVASAAPRAGEPFDTATDLFEAAWYGGAAVGPEDLERMVAAAVTTLDASLAADMVSASDGARR